MASKGRRRFTPKQKLEIVVAGLSNGEKVSEVCRTHGISTNQYYTWRNQLLGSAEAVYGGRKGADPSAAKVERMAQEITRMKDVVAEITVENLAIKKGLWP